MRRNELIRFGEAVLLIAAGGFLGANLRYALGAVAGDALLVTLLVNGVGSFGLGLLLFDARGDAFLPQRIRYVFGTGFFASFTTYSTFIADIAASEPVVAILYIGASYATGFGAILASRRVVDIIALSEVQSPLRGDR